MDTIEQTAQRHEFEVKDVEYLRHGDKPLLVRLYLPKGAGPFPAVVDIHAGGWGKGTRTTETNRHEAYARAGIVVASPDFRQGREGAYPLSVADLNYCIRWVKAHANEFKTRPDLVGLSGQSSGAHLAMLLAMRPFDPRYTQYQLPAGSPDVDAKVPCVAMCWPPINPLSRYRTAKHQLAHPELAKDWPVNVPPNWPAGNVKSHDNYWQTEENMTEGSPTLILERGEKVVMPPAIWIQIKNDPLHNYRDPESPFPGSEPERFVANYRKAGGNIDIVYFDAPFKFTHDYPDLPETTEAFRRLVEFIHRHIPVKA